MKQKRIQNSEFKEFTDLSEQELDRIEMLVQNLLKITRLDAGTTLFEKSTETVSGIVHDVAMRFAYRAEHEQKEIILSGADDIMLVCDRDWIIEAIDNIVKNALDHTEKGASKCNSFVGYGHYSDSLVNKIQGGKLRNAPQHNIGAEFSIIISESAVAAVLFRYVPYGLDTYTVSEAL